MHARQILISCYNTVHKRTEPISTGEAEAFCPKIFCVARIFKMIQPLSHAFNKTACACYIFYAILKWHRNGYKQNNTNWPYVKSKSAELFRSDPRLWEDKDFCPKNGNVARKSRRCPNLRGLQTSSLPDTYACALWYRWLCIYAGECRLIKMNVFSR